MFLLPRFVLRSLLWGVIEDRLFHERGYDTAMGVLPGGVMNTRFTKFFLVGLGVEFCRERSVRGVLCILVCG